MKTTRLAKESHLFGRTVAIVLAASAIAIAPAQMGSQARRPRLPKPKIKSSFVPIGTLIKTAGFPLVQLPASGYIMMLSELATLPKGFAGKLTAPQPVVMLTFGSKKGGVIRLYETPAVAGIQPDALVREIEKARVFKDISNRPEWTVKGRSVGGLFLVPTSSSMALVDAAWKALGH